ncbi:hypothetical protein ANCDUO_03939 [Ancylostoma duodenale]|uniref:Ig-like domain-containing protein n=1 Tax=Ancylostoma duodenale TaxID=51022 RepID=A0A0C2H2E2_9BILA|nr:hypothetical protein ANCDUO_03939 [Ancylostoma duodenale]
MARLLQSGGGLIRDAKRPAATSVQRTEVAAGLVAWLSTDKKTARPLQANTDTTVAWYVNNQLIQNQKLEWRVTVSTEGILRTTHRLSFVAQEYTTSDIWPLLEEDDGSYECAVDGQMTRSTSVSITPSHSTSTRTDS